MIRLPFIRLGFRLVFLGFALGVVGVAPAVEPLVIDLRLLDELNERELFDYSTLHVDKMLRLYPQAKDQILVAKARTLYASHKSKDAAAVVAQIPKNSPFYPEAMLLKGEASARVRKYDEAAAAYSTYFRKGVVEKRLPDGTDEAAVARFRRHVSLYKGVLEKTGNTKEAQRVVGLLGKIKGAADERGTKFLQLRTVLDAEERKLDQGQSVDQAAVNKALVDFGQLVFIRDGVGALSYIEMARAEVLLGGDRLNKVVKAKLADKKKEAAEMAKIRNFIKAVELLKSAGPLLQDMAKAQGGGGELLAGALFYQGKAYRGQALSKHFQKKPALGEKLMKGAAQCFEKVATEFGDSRFQAPALAEHEKCRKNAKALFDETITLAEGDGSAVLKLKLEKGHTLFQRKDYKGAIPIYLEAARAGRLSKKLPTVVSPLVVAMGKEGRFLEAEALASYLVEIQRDNEMTGLCVLQLGASLKQAAKAEQDPARKQELDARAITAWEWFVDVAPLDNRAPMVAYAVADFRYSQAIAIARQAKGEKDAKAREEGKARTRQAMIKAIPKFQFVVDEYGTSSYAPGALYKLGWCFYETGQRREAAEAFLQYADNDELNPKLGDQRLQAKFRAAECMMLGGQAEESVAEFQELVRWTAADNGRGFNAKGETAKRLGDAARMDVGYAYDQTAETLRPQLSALQDRAKAADKEVKTCDKLIAQCNERLAALPQERARIDEAAANAKKQYTAFELDFTEAARKTALAQQDEDPDTLAGDLRAKALAQLKIDTERMLEITEKQARENAKGELANLKTEAEEINAAKGALAKRVGQLVADIATVRDQLPEAGGLAEPTGEAVERLPALAATLEASVKILREETRQAEEKRAKEAAELVALSKKLSDDLEVRKAALDGRVTTLRDDVDATNNTAEKARLAKERDRAEAELKGVQKQLETGYARREELTKATAGSARRAKERASALVGAGSQAVQLAREGRRASLTNTLLIARLAGTARARAFTGELAKALDEPAAGREKLRGKLSGLGGPATKAYEAVREARGALLDEEQSTLREQIAENQGKLAVGKASQATAEAALVPVRTQFEGWKRQAIGAFEAYRDAPGGTPLNHSQVLAKLGTVFLELGDFPAAEKALSRLAKEHPESEAGQGALFNLARSQFETGKQKEASASFTRVLGNVGKVSLSNLQYIGRAMLDTGQFAPALKACVELVARSRDKTHADYAQAQVIRANSLYRAGNAALGLKRPKDALKYMDALLKENPRTGFFYEIKFATAEARRQLKPPDLAGARKDLDDIFNSRDQVLKNRADYQLGEMWTGTKDAELVGRGVRRLREVVDLADPAVPENLPWIEKATVAAARAYARLGLNGDRDAMVRSYRERFPKGKYLAGLKKLPPAEFRK